MIQVGLPIGNKRPNINMGFVAGREIEILGSHGFDACDLPLLKSNCRGSVESVGDSLV